jgi:hypothetical protein
MSTAATTMLSFSQRRSHGLFIIEYSVGVSPCAGSESFHKQGQRNSFSIRLHIAEVEVEVAHLLLNTLDTDPCCHSCP